MMPVRIGTSGCRGMPHPWCQLASRHKHFSECSRLQMTKTANSASKAALIRRHHLPLYAYDYVNFSVWFHAVDSLRRGSGVERIVPLRFRAGCRKRRL